MLCAARALSRLLFSVEPSFEGSEVLDFSIFDLVKYGVNGKNGDLLAFRQRF